MTKGREWKNPGLSVWIVTDWIGSVREVFVVEWRIKLEARSGWGEVETIEVAHIKRRVVGLTAEEIGLSLEEAKQILAELQRLVLQTQI